MTTRLEKVKQLQNLLISRATGGDVDDREYEQLRIELLKDSEVSKHFPEFVKNYDELSKFWGFIKLKFTTYQERRVFI